MFKRLLYLAYYFQEIDRLKLAKFFKHARQRSGKSTIRLWSDIIGSVLTYNISILDYFYFRFYELSASKRSTYAGTGFMYEYQLKMNPRPYRGILENKVVFLERYSVFVRRAFASIAQIKRSELDASRFLNNKSGKIVLKGSMGQIGAEVKVVSSNGFNADKLVHLMISKKLDLIEEYVEQHPDLMRLSPSGLNTVRIFTQVYNGSLVYLGARLRVSINSYVDNMAAGNIAAPIDIDSGIVTGPGVFSDITKDDVVFHPVTGERIVGFQIPFWNETLAMIEGAAFVEPGNASIGWDIAITEAGPELIEGNHNWCKLLWQLPVKMGMKAELEKFL